MTEAEFEQRLRALQHEISEAYLIGYEEARRRAQWTIAAAVDESTRLRNALESALDEVREESTRVRILAALHRNRSTDQ